MIFTITDITRCPGNTHWHFTVQVGSQTHNLQFETEDFSLEPRDLKESFIARVRSVVKEAGVTNFTQIKTALVNKEFKL